MGSNGQPDGNVVRGTGTTNPGASPESSRELTVLVQLVDTLRQTGFEACEVIVGVDFTKSNFWNGKESFGGKSLHDVDGATNPYLETLKFIAEKLKWLDDDSLIPCYGFGDVRTGHNSVFSFYPGNEMAKGLDSLVERYKQIVQVVNMSGPTTFAPLIRQAMRDVHKSGMRFHVLFILADGQISEECLEETTTALGEAASFPMFIFMVGIGDGPWDEMRKFDDEVLPNRAWDNFHFFEYKLAARGDCNTGGSAQGEAVNARLLDEIPKQFAEARTRARKTDDARVQQILASLSDNLVLDPPNPTG